MHTALAARLVKFAVGVGVIAAMVGCAASAEQEKQDSVDQAEEHVESTQEAMTAVEGGGECLPTKTTSTSTTTTTIPTSDTCGGAFSMRELQVRAGAVFKYLFGGAAPTDAYPCVSGGQLDYAALDAIKGTLAYGVESTKISDCYFGYDCGYGASRHLLTYNGTSSTVANAYKNLAANVNSCWAGAGTFVHPSATNGSSQYENMPYNKAENCQGVEAYVRTTTTTTRTYDGCDGTLLSTTTSTTYHVGCFRTDPEPALLTNDLNLSANNYSATSVQANNTSIATPYSYSYQNTWKYDPYGLAAGTPCVSQQFASATMGYPVYTWYKNSYVNNFIQVSGSYRRCVTAQ